MKKIISLILAIIMVFTCVSVLADSGVGDENANKYAASIAKLEVQKVKDNAYTFKFLFGLHPYTKHAYTYVETPVSIKAEYSVNGGEWKIVAIKEKATTAKEIAALDGTVLNTANVVFKDTDYVEFRLFYISKNSDGTETVSEPSNILSFGEKVEAPVEPEAPELICSDWAKEELAKAEAVIPASLKTADLTKNITRAEFAAVAVKAYEALKGETAQPVAENPFTDTEDVEVLKAFNIGITTGTSETTFEPAALLNREQAATMLTRAYSKEKVEFEKPTTFADDAQIDDWAQDSVYFMASKKIINGVGDNKFAPDDNCSREQAIIIAARMVANLK